MILLIHPPVVKPSEPPAGIARLAGVLAGAGEAHRLLDLNLEGLLHLAGGPPAAARAEDTWTRRAVRDRERNLASLRDPLFYGNTDRYRRAVRDLERVLARVSPEGIRVGLADYRQERLSPVRSRDLLQAAERPEENPFHPFFRARLREVFDETAPSTVGISVNYLSQALCAFSLAGLLRRSFPKIRLIMGGGLVTSWRRHSGWQDRFSGLVDRFVCGDGEEELLQAIGRNGGGGEGFPRPVYGDLPLDSYLSPGRVLPYSASTGCHWSRCAFCPERAEGNPYRPVPTEQALGDIRALADETNPSLVHLLDNALPPALLDALGRTRLPVPWYGFARVGRRLADRGFCMDLRRSGCVMLQLGVESGDPAVLEALQKGTTVEWAAAALDNLKSAGIAASVYLLFGTPAETEASARKTLEFVARHGDRIDFLNLAIFNLPVFGRIAPEVETRTFYEGDLSLYTGFVHPRGWDRKRVRHFLDREFRRHPVVSRILRNAPPVFTTNHAPFFILQRQPTDTPGTP